MEQDVLEQLLGRPLTPNEVANRELYLEIAQESLEELLCISLDVDDSSGDPEQTVQVFDIREGYSTVFTGIFTGISEVKVDGVATTDYYSAFWDKKVNPYYNSIVLNDCSGREVEITALWGFEEVPKDLQMLWAQLFANVAKKYTAGSANVKSKQVEDFRITYGDLTDDQAFLDANKRAIRKYSLCNVGYIIHGDVCELHRRRNCGYCI